jgi:hypothetical protein
MNARLKKKYDEEVVPAMMKDFGYKNALQVPRLERITLNMALSEATQNVKVLDSAAAELAAITGQRPVITKAKKAIAKFQAARGRADRLHGDAPRDRMYEFLDRLIHAALPRVRDFKGIPGEVVRRPRQLFARSPRPDYLSRNRGRQGGQIARSHGLDRDDRAYRRRRPGAAQVSGHAVRRLKLEECIG